MSDGPSRTNAAEWADARDLDLTGLKCPLPSLLTAKALRSMAPRELLAVTLSEGMAPLDVRHLCQSDEHEVLAEVRHENGARRLLLRRGPR